MKKSSFYTEKGVKKLIVSVWKKSYTNYKHIKEICLTILTIALTIELLFGNLSTELITLAKIIFG